MLLGLIQLLAVVGTGGLVAAWLADNDMFAIVGGLLGTFAWGLVAYGLFNVETVTDGGTVVSSSEPALALFAAAAGIAAFVPALVDPFEAIGDARDADDPVERL
jgi:hypothetical protein